MLPVTATSQSYRTPAKVKTHSLLHWWCPTPTEANQFDFYFIHSVINSIFFSSFLRQPWISPANKAKLLEYQGRMDLCQYASRRAPTPLLEEVENYVPKREEASDWESIFGRINKIDDDGHGCKLIRALSHGERLCAPWEQSEKLRIRGKMWLKLGNMGKVLILLSSLQEILMEL